MGVRVEVSGIPYEGLDYSVTEEATPVSLDDTSQDVGSFSVTVQVPEEHRYRPREASTYRANRVWVPLPGNWDTRYNPADYAVELVTPGDPLSPLRVTKLTNATGDPFVVLSSVQPVPEGYHGSIRYTFSGTGTFRYSILDRPPREMAWSPATWFTMSAGVTYDTNDIGQDDAIYPYPTPIALELRYAGNTITFNRASILDVPGSSDAWNKIGDDPRVTEKPAVQEGTDPILTFPWTVRRSYRWDGPRNASPSLAVVSAEPLLPSARERVLRTRGAVFLRGDSIRIIDTDKGVVSGYVQEVDYDPDSGIATLDCTGGLAPLNAYNVTALPTNLSAYEVFDGTLREAVQYYAALAGVDFIYVDPSVADRPVSYPGWTGETWFHLKQLATVQGCEISFVSGYPVFRPIRGRITEPGRWLSRTVTVSEPDRAQAVEAYSQNLRDIRDEYVIHPDRNNQEVLSAVPGAREEFIVDLNASVYRLTYIGAFFTDEEGRPLSWEGAGAHVRLSEDNSSQVIVTLHPPRDLATERVYIGRLVNETRIPGLYVRADGVEIFPEKITVASGVAASETGTVIGATLDSPFLTTDNEATLAARQVTGRMSGDRFELKGVVTNVNRRGDSGSVTTTTYFEAAATIEEDIPGASYSAVQGWAILRPTGNTYSAVRDYFDSVATTDYRFQEFGNVAGSRIWDQQTRRWFRVRRATVTREAITLDAEDDLTLGEAVAPWVDSGMTYQQVHMSLPSNPWAGGYVKDRISYREVERLGVADVA